MKKTMLLLAILTTGTAALKAQEISTATMRQITLEETYTLALAQSETLAQQGEYITQLQQAERLAAAAFKPTLALTGSEYTQQNAVTQSKGYLTAAYSVFSGMRDYISAKAAAAKTGSAKLTLDRARQQLYLSAAQAYLGLLEAQRELAIRSDEIGVDNQRIAELQSRADIGRSRTSEVVAAQTQLAQDKASHLGASSSERLAQQVLKFLTGLSEDLAPQALAQRDKADLQFYLTAAMSRPDVAASRKAYETASYLADVQSHNVWPAVTAAGNYYVLRNPMPSPGTTDRWDATLTLSVPLYTGDSASAQRESAYAGKRSAALAVQLAERQALSDVRSAFDEFQYISLEADSLDNALKLAQQNAHLQQEDYKMGLVTNLDVLSALATVEQTRLALSQSRSSQHLALITLETAAGLEAK